MDFSIGEDLQLFENTLDRFLADKDMEKQKAPASANSKAVWSELMELGVLAASLPDEAGGLGMGEKAIMVVMRQFGKHLFDSPFLSSIIIAGHVLARIKDHPLAQETLEGLLGGTTLVSPALTERSVFDDLRAAETKAESVPTGYRLTGNKLFVEYGGLADYFLVSSVVGEQCELALFLVPASAEGVSIQRYQTVDGEELATVSFDQVNLSQQSMLAQSDSAADVLEYALALANFAIAADTLGGVQEAFRITLEYLRTREQFGCKLSSFQALQHRCSDLHTEIEMLHSLVLGTAESFSRGDRGRIQADVSAAKALAVTVGDLVGREAIHLHGAIGMTEELGIGSYLMRTNRLGRLYGGLDYQRERLIDLYMEDMA